MPKKHINQGGQLYQLVVLLVHSKENGVPKLCTIIQDDRVVSLSGGEEFMTAYVPAHMLKEQKP